MCSTAGLQPLPRELQMVIFSIFRLGVAKSEVIHVTNKIPEADEFSKPPEFKEQPEVEIKEAGATASFRCSAKEDEGTDEPEITW